MEQIDNPILEAPGYIFHLTSFPATCGDSFWLTYGTLDDQHHVLIDGGTASGDANIGKHIEKLPNNSELELMIVTHYDSDHIEGIRKLLLADRLPIHIKEIWFNDYDRLDTSIELETFGARMGEELAILINKHDIPWNISFNEKAVVISSENPKSLPIVTLPGGLKLTLLSPYQKQLSELKPVWEQQILDLDKEAGYGAKIEKKKLENFGSTAPEFEKLWKNTFSGDNDEGNGSSIAVLAEFNGKSILFSADAFSEVIMKSLDILERKKITLLKVSHHGGSRNTDPKLIDQIDCRHFLFSTNKGSKPTEQTLAYILKSTENPNFYFNYKSQNTKDWENDISKMEYGYHTQYPSEEALSINVHEITED